MLLLRYIVAGVDKLVAFVWYGSKVEPCPKPRTNIDHSTTEGQPYDYEISKEKDSKSRTKFKLPKVPPRFWSVWILLVLSTPLVSIFGSPGMSPHSSWNYAALSLASPGESGTRMKRRTGDNGPDHGCITIRP